MKRKTKLEKEIITTALDMYAAYIIKKADASKTNHEQYAWEALETVVSKLFLGSMK